MNRDKYVIIDTEGSALFDFKRPADAEGQPRLAELAMLLVDENLQVTGERHFLIRPDGWEMSAEATAINGLTMDMLSADGIPVVHALDAYAEAIGEGRVVVAHNAQHDCKTMRAELRRAGRDDLFLQTRNSCTMRAANGYVIKADGKKGWPKLSDCCAHFEIEVSGAHRAMDDARACLEVFRKLVEIGAALPGAVHFAKNKPEGTPDRKPAGRRVGKAKPAAVSGDDDIPE